MLGMVDKIENARQEMINSIQETGYTSKKTVELSQLLDRYIVEQQKENLKTYKVNLGYRCGAPSWHCNHEKK
jgi:uncharacterized FlgJ-related protein